MCPSPGVCVGGISARCASALRRALGPGRFWFTQCPLEANSKSKNMRGCKPTRSHGTTAQKPALCEYQKHEAPWCFYEQPPLNLLWRSTRSVARAGAATSSFHILSGYYQTTSSKTKDTLPVPECSSCQPPASLVPPRNLSRIFSSHIRTRYDRTKDRYFRKCTVYGI